LSEKMEAARSEEQKARMEKDYKEVKRKGRKEKSTFEKIFTSTTTRQIGRTVARELTRGLLGVLGIRTTTRRRRRKSSWF